MVKFFLETILKIAKELANEKNYKGSSSLFHLLTMLSPNIVDFWIGLGISLQEGQAISEAITIYRIAQNLTNGEHPLPLLYLSEALSLDGSQNEAKDAFELASSFIKKDEKYHIYSEEANRIKNIIY